MYEEFDGRTRTKIVRDADGVARVLSHTDRHVAVKAATPQAAASAYLNRYGHLFGLKQHHLKNLDRGVAQDPTGAAGRLSFLARKIPIRRDHRRLRSDPLRARGLGSGNFGDDEAQPAAGHRRALDAAPQARCQTAVRDARRESQGDRRRNLGQMPRPRRRRPPRRAADHQCPKIHDLSLPRGDAPARNHAGQTRRPAVIRPPHPALASGACFDPRRQGLRRPRRLFQLRFSAGAAAALGGDHRSRDLVGAAGLPVHRQRHGLGVQGRSGDARRPDGGRRQRRAQSLAQPGQARRPRSRPSTAPRP